jgi:hypothetical protein
MSSEYFCKFCDISCTGKAPYEQHLKSAKHLKKAKFDESPPSSEQFISTNSNRSSPITSSHTPSFETNENISEDSSISSASFSISPETMRILLEWNHPRGHKPYCDICQLPLHGENNADIHYQSINNIHSQKLAVWKKIQENDAPYSCTVCYEIFSNENSMRDHFISEAHGSMIQQKTNLRKFIQIYQTYNKLKQARIQRKGSFEDSLNRKFILLFRFRINGGS